MYLNINCNSSLRLPQHEINSNLYPWIIAGFFWPETKMALEAVNEMQVHKHQMQLGYKPYYISCGNEGFMACHITYDHFSAAQQTHAWQFILPRLYMHSVSRSSVWVSANAISANLMVTERHWCKAEAPTWWRDGRMPNILHNSEVCAVWWFVQSPEAIFVSLVFVAASHQL